MRKGSIEFSMEMFDDPAFTVEVQMQVLLYRRPQIYQLIEIESN